MKKMVVGFGIMSLLVFPAALLAEAQVELKPLSIGALQEFGILRGGHFDNDPVAFENEWVDHFGAFVTQTAKFNERLTFNIGLGGIFEFQSPQVINPEWGGSQYKSFFIGPTTADLNYAFGNIENPIVSLQFGSFPIKYSASSNLGEYLFRSGPYPSFIWTGGYAQVNSASAYIQGLRVNITPIKNLSFDLFVNTETNIPPLYDFTLTGLVKYTIADGLLELGGGVQLKRLISNSGPKFFSDGTRATSEDVRNSYFVEDGVTYVGNRNYYAAQKDFWNRKKLEATKLGDTALANTADAQRIVFDTIVSRVGRWTDPAASTHPDYNYFTAAGTTVMGRFTFDPKKIISSELFGKNDLLVYGEAAVLGLKNYPVFYEKVTDRMPLMIGVNLPGFKIFDLVSFEYEYFHSPWMNSYSELGNTNFATPTFSNGADKWTSDQAYNDIANKDNVSWSLLISKKVAHSINITGQMARDHSRVVSLKNWFGPGVDPNEVLSTSKDWYWMLQFSCGI